MSGWFTSTDELMDFACHFLIEGEKGIEYSDAELMEAIERARFERVTRCKGCRWSREINGFYMCCCEGVALCFVDGNHFCSHGEPKETN